MQDHIASAKGSPPSFQLDRGRAQSRLQESSIFHSVDFSCSPTRPVLYLVFSFICISFFLWAARLVSPPAIGSAAGPSGCCEPTARSCACDWGRESESCCCPGVRFNIARHFGSSSWVRQIKSLDGQVAEFVFVDKGGNQGRVCEAATGRLCPDSKGGRRL